MWISLLITCASTLRVVGESEEEILLEYVEIHIVEVAARDNIIP